MRTVPTPDVLVTHLEGEAILLHMGTRRYFRLNRTGAYIWKLLEEGRRDDEIPGSLMTHFDVTVEEAGTAFRALVAELVEYDLVQPR